MNLTGFKNTDTLEETPLPQNRRGRDSAKNLIKIIKIALKDTRKMTEAQEQYLRDLWEKLEQGAVPKKICTKALKALTDLKEDLNNPLKVLAVLQSSIADDFLKDHYADKEAPTSGKREVILSLYLSNKRVE